jgi:hypothetical protein
LLTNRRGRFVALAALNERARKRYPVIEFGGGKLKLLQSARRGTRPDSLDLLHAWERTQLVRTIMRFLLGQKAKEVRQVEHPASVVNLVHPVRDVGWDVDEPTKRTSSPCASSRFATSNATTPP